MKVVTEVTIDARRERVWQTFLSVERWPEWSPWRLHFPERAAMAVGAPFSVSVPLPLLPRLRLRFDCRVSALENPSLISWTGRALGIHGSHRFRFEDADGGCRLVSEEELRGPLALLLRPLTPLIHSRAAAFLSRLRDAATAARTQSPPAQRGS